MLPPIGNPSTLPGADIQSYGIPAAQQFEENNGAVYGYAQATHPIQEVACAAPVRTDFRAAQAADPTPPAVGEPLRKVRVGNASVSMQPGDTQENFATFVAALSRESADMRRLLDRQGGCLARCEPQDYARLSLRVLLDAVERALVSHPDKGLRQGYSAKATEVLYLHCRATEPAGTQTRGFIATPPLHKALVAAAAAGAGQVRIVDQQTDQPVSAGELGAFTRMQRMDVTAESGPQARLSMTFDSVDAPAVVGAFMQLLTEPGGLQAGGDVKQAKVYNPRYPARNETAVLYLSHADLPRGRAVARQLESFGSSGAAHLRSNAPGMMPLNAAISYVQYDRHEHSSQGAFLQAFAQAVLMHRAESGVSYDDAYLHACALLRRDPENPALLAMTPAFAPLDAAQV